MKYVCQICGFIYDDEKEKIPFSQLPDNWKCPICGASKSDFTQAEDKPKETANVENNHVKMSENISQEDLDDLKKLSDGQLAVIFSNLARGCEKQYKPAEAKSFGAISEYFSKKAEISGNFDVKDLERLIKSDIENYPKLRAVADEAGDRGAARVCVWGEKVTRMISSILERYENEGDSMLDGMEIWVCTVCGFVFIGKNPPALCPVCKVPDWKFEKIEGRI